MLTGRPHKYDPETMDAKILELAEAGGSFVEMCCAIGICRATGYNWMDEKHASFQQSFLDIIKKARSISQAWWERQGRTQLENSKFNATLFNKQIAGRFPDDWRDVSRLDHTSKDEKISIGFMQFDTPEE